MKYVHPQPIIVFWMNAWLRIVTLSLVFNGPSQNEKVRFKHLADSEPKKLEWQNVCIAHINDQLPGMEEIQTHRWPKNHCLFSKMPVTCKKLKDFVYRN